MSQEIDHGPRLGADPELFVKTTSEGNVVPICGKIGGTKENPLIINDLINERYGAEAGRRSKDSTEKIGNYAIQEDNVMLEFNIPAYKDTLYFTEAITKILTVLDADVLPPHGIQTMYSSTHTFKPEDIAPFPQAFTVGCLSDMNAYAGRMGQKREPFNATHFGNNRFCGGHLHVQYNKNHVPPYVFAQFMDAVVALPFLRWDKQKLRRMFYGQPGIYREKPYGIEYRTPSNFWLQKTFREKHLYSLSENVISLGKMANNDPDHLDRCYGMIDWHDVQEAIKTEDVKLADEIVHYMQTKLRLYINTSLS